jgi:GDP-4-dehydro-6-deoxy-D-mannose reductase
VNLRMSQLRILITGAGGFAGRHLSRYLAQAQPQAALHGTVLSGAPTDALEGVTYHTLDLREEAAVESLIEQLQPDRIYHLAAQANVAQSFKSPWDTLENNLRAQFNLLEACRVRSLQPRVLIVSSAEIYGPAQPDEMPIREDAPFRPTSPYSVSKIAQDMLGLQFYLGYRMPILRARAFNHFGPGQAEGYVAPAFAMQIARIEAGLQEPVIRVGDLSAQRDFTDVRDVVRAYHLIVERGMPGAAYNIASGRTYSIRALLDALLAHTDQPIEVMVDPERLRVRGIPVLQGDSTRLRETTGWTPAISFDQMVADLLEDCRQRVKRTQRG